MAEKLTLDVRRLPCPEPLEAVLEAVDALGPEQYLVVLHHRQPTMLFPLLEKRGFIFRLHEEAESCFRVLIWRESDRKAGAAAEAEYRELFA